jgi:hypothetical protein
MLHEDLLEDGTIVALEASREKPALLASPRRILLLSVVAASRKSFVYGCSSPNRARDARDVQNFASPLGVDDASGSGFEFFSGKKRRFAFYSLSCECIIRRNPNFLELKEPHSYG